MPSHLDDFDDEIRGHMALSLKERIERGEDPEAARRAVLIGAAAVASLVPAARASRVDVMQALRSE